MVRPTNFTDQTVDVRRERVRDKKAPYLTILQEVKNERAPLSTEHVNYAEATNPDALKSFSKFHIHGVTLGSLIRELLKGDSNKSFHEERVEVKEFMRGLVSGLQLNLIKPLLRAICGKTAIRPIKDELLENRNKALQAEMAPLIACVEGTHRHDTKSLAQRLSQTIKHDCKSLDKQMRHTTPETRRHLLAEKNIAEAAIRLMSVAA